jgi:hypothetical protein
MTPPQHSHFTPPKRVSGDHKRLPGGGYVTGITGEIAGIGKAKILYRGFTRMIADNPIFTTEARRKEF